MLRRHSIECVCMISKEGQLDGGTHPEDGENHSTGWGQELKDNGERKTPDEHWHSLLPLLGHGHEPNSSHLAFPTTAL